MNFERYKSLMAALLVISLLIGVLLVATLTFGVAGPTGDLAATVNGEPITMAEYNKRVSDVKNQLSQRGVDFESESGQQMASNIKTEILDELITEMLVRQQAAEKGVLFSETEIDQKIKEIKESYPTGEEFEQDLANVGINEIELRKMILSEFSAANLYQKITKDLIAISDEQVREYYQQNKEQFIIPSSLEVRHILFFSNETGQPNLPVQRDDAAAKELARQVIASLEQGADFATLAQEKSEDTGSKEHGGLFKFSPEQGRTDPAFAQAAQALEVGEHTTVPVRSQFGYHVIKLEKNIPAQEKPFEEVQSLIAEQLTYEAKKRHFREFMDGVREEAQIVKKVG
ncbi:peptidylprolyl isomerase [Peptococcaceae bacterium]|nr:peptidylprolyl isomerase [Peptococcaceae bacterium]